MARAAFLPGIVGILLSGSLWLPALADRPTTDPSQPSRDLAAHWPLAGDFQDRSGNGRHAVAHGAVDTTADGPKGQPNTAVALDGRDAYLEIPAGTLSLGKDSFSLSAWVHTDAKLDDTPGDIISQYDPTLRRGFHLTLKTNAGVASSQANSRHLQFSVDNNHSLPWTDCGKPGGAVMAFALTTHAGNLFAGTCEPGENQRGRVYRYQEPSSWIDCGSPTEANAVTAMASHDGKLYVGTGKYRLAGSALEESKNSNLGGRVLSDAGDHTWVECGQLPGVEAIGGLVVFRGKLYASSLYRPAGFFRYDGGTTWTACATPGKRVEALGVYNGYLYATSYDEGHVFRFDGENWTDCGQLGPPEENTQTYSFAVYAGRLYVGTWRTGRVYRFEDVNRWTDAGRLGAELEVMGMLVHNGRLIAGTLPLAEVYSYDGGTSWRRIAQLDKTPNVQYRRAWTMAELQGRVFCSTLPSGRVWSFSAGATAAWDYEFPAGWHHIAAIKDATKLRLYVDGRRVSESTPFAPADYDLTSRAPLRIGLGSNDYFRGRLHDVRLYRRALAEGEIAELAGKP